MGPTVQRVLSRAIVNRIRIHTYRRAASTRRTNRCVGYIGRRISGRGSAPIWLADALLINVRGTYELPGAGEGWETTRAVAMKDDAHEDNEAEGQNCADARRRRREGGSYGDKAALDKMKRHTMYHSYLCTIFEGFLSKQLESPLSR